nr:hypothetical protein [Tanacetum cinerariifolium]
RTLKFIEKALVFVAKETDLFKNEKKRKGMSNGGGLNKRVKKESLSSSYRTVNDDLYFMKLSTTKSI